MNTYDEVMIATSLIILVLGLFGVTIYFKDKIEKLEDTVTNLDAYINVSLVPQIKTIRQLVTDEIINKDKEDEYLKCKFVARLNDQTYHDIRVMVKKDVPYDYIWELAIRECEKFKSPLQQLSFVEEVATSWDNVVVNKEAKNADSD